MNDHPTIKTDTLQRLHAVANLAEILEINGEVPREGGDEELGQVADTLRAKYLSKYQTATENAHVSSCRFERRVAKKLIRYTFIMGLMSLID